MDFLSKFQERLKSHFIIKSVSYLSYMLITIGTVIIGLNHFSDAAESIYKRAVHFFYSEEPENPDVATLKAHYKKVDQAKAALKRCCSSKEKVCPDYKKLLENFDDTLYSLSNVGVNLYDKFSLSTHDKIFCFLQANWAHIQEKDICHFLNEKSNTADINERNTLYNEFAKPVDKDNPLRNQYTHSQWDDYLLKNVCYLPQKLTDKP